jgi:MSHA biogenesis protein MshO
MKTVRMSPPLRRMAGFTLVEAIIVIVVTGILAAVVAIFIRAPVQGYFDSVRRAELTDQADVALRRITRDVRLALPNSLRVATVGNDIYIEFIMTSAGGRYRDPADGSTGGNFLSFTDPLDVTFDVHGPLPAMAIGDSIVIFNLGPGNAPADAYVGGNRATIAGLGGTPLVPANPVTLSNNPFANQSPPLPSPNGRFQVVPGAVRAVSYRCPTAVPGPVQRYANYGFFATQPTPPAGAPSLLISAGATCAVSYAPATGGRNGLLEIRLTLSSGAGANVETVVLQQQIRVDNAP